MLLCSFVSIYLNENLLHSSGFRHSVNGLCRIVPHPTDCPVSIDLVTDCFVMSAGYYDQHPNPLIPPTQCLESSLRNLVPLHSSEFGVTSILLNEYQEQKNLTLLHELVVTASVICILVQIIDHLKPDLRSMMATKWISRNFLHTLG